MKTTELSISSNALKLLNICFHLIHLSIIFFFLFGWLFEKTRLPHFILSILILLSWFGLGAFFGFGYCLVTDMQWKIKRRINQEPSTEFYVKYMIDKVTGLDTNPRFINRMTTYIYFGILIISIILLSMQLLIDNPKSRTKRYTKIASTVALSTFDLNYYTNSGKSIRPHRIET